MKKYILLLAALLVMGCSSDYLNTEPTSSTSPDEVFSSTSNARNAINGMAKQMVRQYKGQGFNGEGTIKMYYGNYMGNHFYRNLTNFANVMNMNFNDDPTSTYTVYPWFYYYKMIGNANVIISKIDGAKGPEEEKMFIKAQGLTYRAYSYFMLSQIYGLRWIDSQDGETPTLVLRLIPDMEPQKLSSLKEVYEQIYKDLDEAIQLFTASNMKRSNFFDPNINVAYAIYARAAITKQDYKNAEQYAALARAGFPLMDVDKYQSGFENPTSEWIWGSYGAPDENLYFYSYQAYMAYNSTASVVRNYPTCISNDLYNKIPETDIRKELFLNPGADYIPSGAGTLSENAEKEPEQAALAKAYRKKFPLLAANATLSTYMQFKISCFDFPGVGNLNHFRSSEMYLIEAEAKHKLGKDTEAQALMNALIRDSNRDPEYSCEVVGDELFAEIKFYRNIELWGEGFDWFDLKRWGDDRVRNSYTDAANPGVFPPVMAITIKPHEKNKWTFKIPTEESNFNPEIDY